MKDKLGDGVGDGDADCVGLLLNSLDSVTEGDNDSVVDIERDSVRSRVAVTVDEEVVVALSDMVGALLTLVDADDDPD